MVLTQYIPGATAAFIILITAIILRSRSQWPFHSLSPARKSNAPVSVNYHFTRQCNRTCGFCFHTATTSFKESPENAKRGLAALKKAGMRKINFAGGEPFLHKPLLGAMITFCKEVLALESVSIVTNGSLVDENFLKRYGKHIDIMAVSCDSFDEKTNIAIGRGSGDQVPKLFQIAEWCKEYGIKFKLNTVVCRLNYTQEMNQIVSQLNPFRWKCFQVLMVRGENDSEKTLRDVRKFQISAEEYQQFCDRHQQQPSFVAEPNHLMAKSYLILDEYMRFLDRDGRQPSSSILNVSVSSALAQVYWDHESFVERGGIYDWSRDSTSGGCTSTDAQALEW